MALEDLADRYGTPLYVYDAATVRERLRAYRAAFAPYAPVRVGYSAKACALVGVLRLLRGAPVSAASVGELEAASAAGLDPRRAWLHGNAKTAEELARAVALGVGRVVIDGEEEVDRLARVARRPQAVWLRLSPAVDAPTHAHLRTGTARSKFGFPIAGGLALRVAARVAREPRLRLVGIHAHPGSQIDDLGTFRATARALVDFARQLRRELGVTVREVCVGGGLASPEAAGDRAPDLAAYARAVAAPVRAARDLGRTVVVVEPGRSIVGNAAVALYRVVERREIAGERTSLAVDGGMGDNIRPALYGSRYAAALAGRADEEASETVAIAGAYCEAGDVLIREVALPHAAVGDVVAIPAAGAYAVAMASNYNHRPRPAVALVDGGRAALIRRRERTSDLLRCERGGPRLARARAGRGARGGRGSRGG